MRIQNHQVLVTVPVASAVQYTFELNYIPWGKVLFSVTDFLCFAAWLVLGAAVWGGGGKNSCQGAGWVLRCQVPVDINKKWLSYRYLYLLPVPRGICSDVNSVIHFVIRSAAHPTK